MNWYDTIIEPWSYSFMVRGFTVTLIAATVCALISCWLVLIGWSLLGDAISHAILPGVACAYIVNIPFAIGAIIAALIAVAFIGVVKDTTRIKEDTAIGVVFTTFFAAGLVIVSVNPTHIDVQHILFGDMLGITKADMWQVLLIAPIVAIVLIAKRRDLILFAFDPTHAAAIGLAPKLLAGILLSALALTTVVAMQAVGAILIVALLIIPGASAYLLTNSFNKMLWIAPGFAALSVLIGTYVSYWWDAASGAMVVTTQGILFGVIYLAAPGGLRAIVHARQARKTGPQNRPVNR